MLATQTHTHNTSGNVKPHLRRPHHPIATKCIRRYNKKKKVKWALSKVQEVAKPLKM